MDIFEVDLADSMLNDDTASVGGKQVHRADFAYVGDPKDKSTWKLPIHDESHVRSALARFGQTDLPADAKAGVWRRIVAAAKKFGIEGKPKVELVLCYLRK